MIHKGDALLCAISGVVAARTKPVYERVKDKLPKRIPTKRIAFLGNPFVISGRRTFPLPLLWGAEERSLPPTTRLLSCWWRLDQFSVNILRPALAECDVVFVERFGLDALLNATACCDSAGAINETERMHHALVKIGVVERGISVPRYFIPSADIKDTRNLKTTFPRLRDTDPAILRAFMEYEADALRRYFDPKYGQIPPCPLPISMTVDEMCEKIIEVVEQHIWERAAA